ncbi:MAG: SOS response-associated peptidase [Anaerolineae bacterium]|jgi:putative SOS response-associated peptidase YedK|nr:SOS response-associated peptidase [Anaerolineae bacterium]
MCGRFVLTADAQQLQLAFGLETLPAQMVPRYNIAPTQPVAVITNAAPTTLTFQRWGLVPSWAKDPSIGSQMFNARAETAAEKPSFKHALRRRRCLIPANGFYEWPVKGKNPIYIYPDDPAPFAFAGLWEVWRGPDGEELPTCTILTTEPNEFMKAYHHRMAVILPPDLYGAWLSPAELSPAEALDLLRPMPADGLRVHEVGKLGTGAEGPECIAPVNTQGTLF